MKGIDFQCAHSTNRSTWFQFHLWFRLSSLWFECGLFVINIDSKRTYYDVTTEWNGTLEVRQGLTSQSPLVETLTGDSKMMSEYLIPADIGFYIRLRGRLSSEFIMAIAYTAFSYAGNVFFWRTLLLLLFLPHLSHKYYISSIYYIFIDDKFKVSRK